MEKDTEMVIEKVMVRNMVREISMVSRTEFTYKQHIMRGSVASLTSMRKIAFKCTYKNRNSKFVLKLNKHGHLGINRKRPSPTNNT